MGVNQSRSQNIALGVISTSFVKPNEETDKSESVKAISESTITVEESKLEVVTDTQKNISQSDVKTSEKPGLKKSIEVVYSGNQLALTTIMHILEASPEIAGEDFVEVTMKNRKERRELRKVDENRYEELVLEYNEQIEQILENAQLEILESLNIPRETFEESVISLMERGFFQQFFMVQAQVRSKIKEKLHSSRLVTREETKELIKFQVKILKQKPKYLVRIVDKLKRDPEQAQLIPLTLNTMLSDLIFEKFGIEEEDQIKSMVDPSLLTDPEVQGCLMQIEQAMFSLMGQGEPGVQQMQY